MGPILFLHIPRTGGMSLKEMCVGSLGASRCLTDVHFLRVGREDGFDLGAYDFVEGHVVAGFFGLTTAAAAWPSSGYTILRDPVERVVSQAVHLRHRPDQARGDEGRADLRREVRDPHSVFERFPALCDLQTRQLGFPPFRWSHRRADESAYEAAVALVDRLAFGLTEEFSVSTALFVERFGLRLPRMVRTNSTAPDGDHDLRGEEFRAAAAHHNRYDRRLYERAVAVFADRVAAHVGTLLAGAADEGVLDVRLDAAIGAGGDAVRMDPGATALSLRGSVLVGGKAPDAVLVRVGSATIPIGCGFASPRRAEETGDPDHRSSGIAGRVPVPPDVSAVEVIAFDRTRGRRGSVRLDVARADTPSGPDGGARSDVG